MVCHASAWDVDYKDDLRIKMCIETNEEDFITIHHELGHNYYQRAYDTLPFLFQDGANDGFHEAIGDTIALSITPAYLKQIGLIDTGAGRRRSDIDLLMKKALDKVAFLPFGLLIDQWRWKVFSGEITPADYNEAWWELRAEVPGRRAAGRRAPRRTSIRAPSTTCPPTRPTRATSWPTSSSSSSTARSARRPATRARCTAARSTATRRRARSSPRCWSWAPAEPWPDALRGRHRRARRWTPPPSLDYFAPLKTWLDEQNKGQKCGW